MNKEIISNKQGICMVVMFTIGSSIVVGIGAGAKQDVWISILIALLASLPLMVIYAKIHTLFPGKDINDILKELFGTVAGKMVSMIFVWYSFHISALIIRSFSEFVNIMSFPETPQFITIIFLGVTCILAVKSGIEVLGRFSAFIFPLIMGIIIIIFILSFSSIHLINIRPVLYNGVQPIISTAFSLFAFPFAEVAVFNMVFHTLKNNKKTLSVFLLGIVIGGGILLFAYVRNILVLGVPTATSLYFPSYAAIRIINIGDFLQRFEASIAIIFMIAGFIKVSICLYAASNGIAKIFNLKTYKRVAVPVGFLMMNLASLLYSNTSDFYNWDIKTLPYYLLPLEVILPVIIYITAKIKLRDKKRN